MTDTPPILDIDVISDVMCPWCFIGKRRLDKAVAGRPGMPVDIRWRPFQLDPTIPPEGMDRQDYLDRKFGPDKAGTVYDQIRAAGAEEGIEFNFDAIGKAPNTLDAHRLIRWAATAGVQGAVVEELFSGYFVEGADLTDTGYLAEAAEAAGMEREIVARLLAGDADRALVEEEIALAQRMGVQGVPCFIFGGKYVVMGAQGPDVLGAAIDRAVQEAPDGADGTAA